VFENRALGRIFGPKRDEVRGEWIKVCNEELNNLYSSLNIVSDGQIRSMRWSGHVALRGREEVHTGFWEGIVKGKDHLETQA
jgi:hypothetical protein